MQSTARFCCAWLLSLLHSVRMMFSLYLESCFIPLPCNQPIILQFLWSCSQQCHNVKTVKTKSRSLKRPQLLQIIQSTGNKGSGDCQVESRHCSCRRSVFDSSESGTSQLPVIPALRDLQHSSGVRDHAHMYKHRHKHTKDKILDRPQ